MCRLPLVVILTLDSSDLRTWCIFSSVCVIFDFFHQHVVVFRVQIFSSLSRLIPRYFILFDVMVNRIVSLISFLFLLLVYRNARNFCVLILYLANLPNSLMRSSRFLVASCKTFYVLYHVICKPWQFYFFSNLDSFDLFSFSDCYR